MPSFRSCSAIVLWAATAVIGSCTDGPASVSKLTAPLTVAQCSFFSSDDTVVICHHTSSTKKPYVKIITDSASCGGHDGHVGDYIAYDDPTCSGQGCYPEGAPFDGTVECCEGLTSVDGICTLAACPEHASDAPACACMSGFSGTLEWSFASSSWTGTCSDIDECTSGQNNCSVDATCTNTIGGFTCTCDAGYTGDGVTCMATACSSPPCISRLSFGGQPTAVAINHTLHRAYVTGMESLVYVVDSTSDIVIDYFAVPGRTYSAAVDEGRGRLYVGSFYLGDPGRGVYALDGVTGEILVSNTEIPNDPKGIAVDEQTGRVLVLVDEIMALDPDTLGVVGMSADRYTSGLAINSATRRLYSFRGGDLSVAILDADTLEQLGHRALSHATQSTLVPNPIGVNSLTGLVYAVANTSENGISSGFLAIYDSTLDAQVGDLRISGDSYARGIAIDKTRDRVLVTSEDGYVTVASGDGTSVLLNVVVGQQPWGIATDAFANKSYIALHSWPGLAVLY